MTPYTNITKAVMLRANQLKDAASAAALGTQFDGALSSNVGGMEVPLGALKLAVLASEKRIADLIGRTKNPILRSQLYAVTNPVNSGAVIQPTSSSGVEFVGHFGNVLDTTDHTPLTEKSKQEVLRRINNVGAFYRLPAYYYFIEDQRIYHTRPSVVLEGCAWSYSAQATAYDATNGSSPLPQSLETFWIADVLANLAQENWFVNEAQLFAGIAAGGEQMLLQGVIPQNVLPDTTANENSVKN